MEAVKTKVCSVTGVTLPLDQFYAHQSHSKTVDNFRRSTGISTIKLKSFINNLKQ